MGRIPRIIVPGEAHHVTQRGNRRQDVFFSRSDYQCYLKLLWANAENFKFSIWSYCLMRNHIHLLIVPDSQDGLREGMATLHQTYSLAINKKNDWKGRLWQGRFFSCFVEATNVPIVARYIELNPVRAGICENPCDYPWSSALLSCSGESGRNGFAPITAPGGTWSEYLSYDPNAATQKSINTIRASVRTGRPFAGDACQKLIEQKTGIKLARQKLGRKPRALAKQNQSGGTNFSITI
jgi:putative transposase